MTTKGDFINKWQPNEEFLKSYDRIFRKEKTMSKSEEEMANVKKKIAEMSDEELQRRLSEVSPEDAAQYAELERALMRTAEADKAEKDYEDSLRKWSDEHYERRDQTNKIESELLPRLIDSGLIADVYHLLILKLNDAAEHQSIMSNAESLGHMRRLNEVIDRMITLEKRVEELEKQK